MQIKLRPLEAKDALISYKWRNDAAVWQFTGSRPDREVTQEMEKKWISEVLKRSNEKRFAICVGEEELYIGNIQLTDINDTEAQFHIFIGDKSYWGKGIASEATKLIIEFAFNTLNLSKLYLFVNKNNSPAIHIYKKNGFIVEKENEKNLHMIIKK